MDPIKFLTFAPIFTALSVASETLAAFLEGSPKKNKPSDSTEEEQKLTWISIVTSIVMAGLGILTTILPNVPHVNSRTPVDPTLGTIAAVLLYGCLIAGGAKVWNTGKQFVGIKLAKMRHQASNQEESQMQ